ncbi:hypothetical protein [Parasphaerochaeta coccoides]|uniref:Lipoprotein n=1 Tax=Parasphaerochaeta coccoides (strain ATCC BAA-1237 / DSM 17374 / SPN1) TaxID=760011 RepID=F4GHB6_PARC1|nr:hypothetical protein [Parasphaerochaeta coccoides]AEC02015.1 hypothetical protein Spico_0790 [Parasphaerochaeta coccoides DSM 17374]
MKIRLSSILLLIFGMFSMAFIIACASLPQDSPEKTEMYRRDVETASRILLERAVQGTSEQLRLEPARPATYMMPEIRTMFLDNSSITGMGVRIQAWERQFMVLVADIATTIPSFMQDDVHAFTIPLDVDAALLAQGTITVSPLFGESIRPALVAHIAGLAFQAMSRTDADGNSIADIWTGIKDSYRIWTEAWARFDGPWRQSLPGIWSATDDEVMQALAESLADDFLRRLSQEEDIIRSTPIADDSDPVALIFQSR